ncbi:MAG: FtsQ-type POTRA domain-containing protein [Firmicutes bacterium]|nr:FtsQ-type POTRA domain-containing protein [Bacillota bacterium]
MKPMNETDNIEKAKARSKFSVFYGILFFLTLLLIFFNSGIFSIEDVLVEGNQDLSPEDVLFITKLNKGKSIFQVNPKKVRENLLQNPQIALAKVTIQFPNRILIEIAERRPICLLSYRDNLLIVGEDATVIGVKDENEPIKLPVVTGIRLGRIQCGGRITNPQFNTAMEILRCSDDNLRRVMSEIDLANYRLYIDLPNWRHTLQVELGNGEQLEEKIALNLRSILSNITPDSLSKIDLRVPSAPTTSRN